MSIEKQYTPPIYCVRQSTEKSFKSITTFTLYSTPFFCPHDNIVNKILSLSIMIVTADIFCHPNVCSEHSHTNISHREIKKILAFPAQIIESAKLMVTRTIQSSCGSSSPQSLLWISGSRCNRIRQKMRHWCLWLCGRGPETAPGSVGGQKGGGITEISFQTWAA